MSSSFDSPLSPRALELLEALIAVRRGERAPLSGPDWADALPDNEAACAVQHALGVRMGWWAQAEVAGHWKSGGASRAGALTHAAIPPAAVVLAHADAPARLPGWPFWRVRVEGEIALRLGRDVTPSEAAALHPDQPAAELAALFDAQCVAIEVVDSRWQPDPLAAAPLRLADLQSGGALVLGAWQPVTPEADWSALGCTLTLSGETPRRFVGTHPLGHPFWGMPAWLQHLTRHGATVPAGTVVTTGTWTGAVPLAPSQTAEVRFDGCTPVAFTLD